MRDGGHLLNLNPYNLNPGLAKAVERLANKPSPKSRLSVYKHFEEGHLIIAVEEIPEEFSHSVNWQEDPENISINIKTSVAQNGKRYLLAFTDLRSLHKRFRSYHPYIIVSCRAALEQSILHGLNGLILNSGGPAAIISSSQAKRLLRKLSSASGIFHRDQISEVRNEGYWDVDFDRALEFAEVGDAKQAVELLKRTVARHPGFVSAHWHLALSHYDLGEYEEAIVEARIISQLKSSHSGIDLLLARCYFRKNDFEQALEYYLLAQKSDPENQAILEELATIYLRIQRYHEAILCYEELLKFSAQETVYLSLGEAQIQAELYEEAIISHKLAIELYPENAQLLLGLARSYALNGELKAAIGSLERAVELNVEILESLFADEEFLELHGHNEFRRLASFYQ